MADKKAPEQTTNVGKEMVLPVVVLVAICIVCSALLAVLNNVTEPVIEANNKKATMVAYLDVLPEGTNADQMESIEGAEENPLVEDAVRTENGDMAVKSSASGYSGKDVTVYISFDADGTITKVQIDASTQTTGIGSKVAEDSYEENYVGIEGSEGSGAVDVDAIAGATYSSNAAETAIKNAVDYIDQLLEGVA